MDDFEIYSVPPLESYDLRKELLEFLNFYEEQPDQIINRMDEDAPVVDRVPSPPGPPQSVSSIKDENSIKDEPISRSTTPHENKKKIKKLHKCPNCNKMISTKYKLSIHIYCKHTPSDEIKWFNCGLCSKKFKLKAHLTSHNIWKHNFCTCDCPCCGFGKKNKPKEKST